MRILTVVTDRGEERFALECGTWLIGRSHSADVRVEDPQVSGKHASLDVSDQGVRVGNLSRFGCWLNGQAVQEDTEWKEGVDLVLSRSARARWHVAGDAEGDAAGLPRLSHNEEGGNTQSSQTVATRAVADFGLSDWDTTIATRKTAAAGPEAGGSVDPPGTPPAGDTVDDPTPVPTAPVPDTAGQEEGVAFGSEADDAASGAGTAGTVPFAEANEAGATGALEEEGVTRELHTRAADPLDLERLRSVGRRKRRRRLWAMVVAAVALIALVASVRPREDPEITEITWPVDDAGKRLEEVLEAPMGGYQVVAPRAKTRVLHQDGATLHLRCDLGRNHEVPLTILVEEQVPPKYWTLSFPDLVAQWTASKAGDQSAWFLDEPFTGNRFVGSGGGIPYAFIPYKRRDPRGADWSGSAFLFRSGPRFSVLCAETPASKAGRMEEFLWAVYVRLPDAFVHAAWEPVKTAAAGSAASRLAHARQIGLDRDAPTQWPAAILSFREALTRAAESEDMTTLTTATQELARLRARQQDFFNRVYLDFEEAFWRNDKKAAARIKRIGEAAFAEPDDARYWELRRWELPE